MTKVYTSYDAFSDASRAQPGTIVQFKGTMPCGATAHQARLTMESGLSDDAAIRQLHAAFNIPQNQPIVIGSNDKLGRYATATLAWKMQ